MDHASYLLLSFDGARAEGNQLPSTPESATRPCELQAPVFDVTFIWEKTSTGAQSAAAGRPHYVNLARSIIKNPLEQHEYGPYITLYAQIAWNDPRCTESLAGHTVRWTFTQVAALAVGPSYLSNRAKDSFGFSWYGVCVNTVDTVTDEHGLTAVAHFYLGNIGGNSYRITATPVGSGRGSAGASQTTGIYEVWRRIPVNQSIARAVPRGLPLARANQYFAPAFIELVDAPADTRFGRRLTVKVKDEDYGANEEQIEVTLSLTQNVTLEDHFRRLKSAKWLERALYRPHGVQDWAPLPSTCQVTKVPMTSATDGLSQPGVPANPDDYTDETAYTTAQDITETTPSRRTRVLINDWRLRSRVQIDITALNPTPLAPVEVKLLLSHKHYTTGDGSAEPTIAFGYLLKTMTQNAAEHLAAVALCHEIGHKVGFYPAGGPTHDTRSEAKQQGNHCDDNACVMYWRAIEGLKAGWCASCVPLLRQTKIEALSLT